MGGNGAEMDGFGLRVGVSVSAPFVLVASAWLGAP
jgi:hypothetical protein